MNNSTCIQECHLQKISEFNNIENIILEKNKLSKKLLAFEKSNKNNTGEREKIKNQIMKLTLQENKVNEYIFSNYELLKNYEQIEDNETLKEHKNTYNLCDVLSKNPSCNINNNKKYEEKNKIIDQYMINLNKYTKNIKYNTINKLCDHCHNKLDINDDNNKENITCANCGKITIIFRDEFKNNKDENIIIRNSIYIRKNHFREWLNHLQGRCNDSKKISKELLDIIDKEIKSMKIKSEDLTRDMLRKILKKNKLSKYYDHEIQILYLINGKKPLFICKETEVILTEYFEKTEIAFEEYKKIEYKKYENKGRKNLLRYSYILYKLCELLELDEYLSHFSLLKDRLKKLEQDKIWKYICRYNNWTFYNTV